MKYLIILSNVESPHQRTEVEADFINVMDNGTTLFYEKANAHPIHVAPSTAFVKMIKE